LRPILEQRQVGQRVTGLHFQRVQQMHLRPDEGLDLGAIEAPAEVGDPCRVGAGE
jgi:hypothetical protein